MPSKLILCRAPGLIKAEQFHAQDSSAVLHIILETFWLQESPPPCIVSMVEPAQDEQGEPVIKLGTSNSCNKQYIHTLPVPTGYPKHPIKFLNQPGVQVLFVGEGNFSFTVAFAAYRRSWKGIWSTRLQTLEEEDMPSVDEVISNCLKSIESYYKNKGPSSTNDCSEKKKSQLMALNPSDFIPWRCDIDATKIHQDSVWRSITGAQPTDRPPFNAIWFQCPWLDSKEKIGKIGTLVREYVCSAAEILQEGGIVCVGIINNSKYTPRYELEVLLKDEEVLKKCDYVGVDNTLVGEMLKLGYNHKGVQNIHKYNLDNHLTLVFAKK